MSLVALKEVTADLHKSRWPLLLLAGGVVLFYAAVKLLPADVAKSLYNYISFFAR